MWSLTKKVRKKPARRGARQAQSLKRRRIFNILGRSMALLITSIAVIAAVYIWKSGLFQQWKLESTDSMDRKIARAGFMVEEVRITGQKQTSLKQVRAALALYDGQSIISLDLENMLVRLKALPWIKVVTLTRIMPDALVVTIMEYEAVALWQEKNQLFLVDGDGDVITGEGVTEFTYLPHVVGRAANENLSSLLAMKQKYPGLFSYVKSATWVGERRWDLNLTNGIKIKLPENAADQAWARLDDYVRHQDILDKEIVIIDLRMPDKTILRLTPAEAERRRALKKLNRKEENI